MILKKRLIESIPSLILLMLAIGYLLVSLEYRFNDRAMPFGVAAVAIVLLVLDLLARGEGALGRNLRRVLEGRAQKKVIPGLDGQAGIQQDPKRELAAFAWIIGFVVLVVVVGFYIAIPIYVISYLWLYGGKSIFRSTATGFGLTLLLYTMFEVLLDYDIFGGLINGGYL